VDNWLEIVTAINGNPVLEEIPKTGTSRGQDALGQVKNEHTRQAKLG